MLRPQALDEGSSYQSPVFRKMYDGLVNTSVSNHLDGTCQKGQLLMQGIEQQMTNGLLLRDAYIYNSSDDNHDPRMRLLDTQSPLASQLFFRVDDDQRTISSGQALLSGMFQSSLLSNVIPMHMADRDRDVLTPNEKVCPRLKELREEFERSLPYQQYLMSDEVVVLKAFMKSVLEIEGDMDCIGCLMTTMCTDRTLPDFLNDFDADWDYSTFSIDPFGGHMFQRLVRHGTYLKTMVYPADNGAYSKLGMSWLWAEILQPIKSFLHESNGSPFQKFALFSGHDETVVPVLVTLGEKVWDGELAPYASMVAIELHEVDVEGGHARSLQWPQLAFRLVYNGDVLTHLMDNCPSDSQLCDVQVLLDTIDTFATASPDCRRQHPEEALLEDEASRSIGLYAGSGGSAVLLLVAVASATLGALGSFLCSRVALQRHRMDRIPTVEPDGLAIDTGDCEMMSNYNDDGGTHPTKGCIMVS